MTAVLCALGGNVLVTAGKLVGFFMTGSSSLLAESVHSAADVANQILLAIGIRKAAKKADEKFNYGYGRDKFVWALISATGIFFVGSGASISHGVSAIFDPHPIESLPIGLAILGASLVCEGLSMAVAAKVIINNAKAQGLSFKEYVIQGTDPMVVAVLLEDGAAVFGVIIAAMSLGLSYATGLVIFDSVGSILVGGLLGWVATFLIRKNRSLLVGQALPNDRLEKVLDILRDEKVIRGYHDVKSVVLGTNQARFKAEIQFDGIALSKLYRERHAERYAVFLAEKNLQDPKQLAEILGLYSDEFILHLSDEVDRIEKRIKTEVPECKHVDLICDVSVDEDDLDVDEQHL